MEAIFIGTEVRVMKGKKKPAPMHPERVLQFGDGIFLRGFVDWMLHRMNEQGLFQGQAVVIQPFAEGSADVINEQNGMYTLLLRGIHKGKAVDETELIGSIRRVINPYTDYKAFLHCALNPDLRFIVSDTANEGIAYSAGDHFMDTPPSTFPAKLTVFLYKRFKAFHGKANKAFIILPCEDKDRNGDLLKQVVLRYTRQWHLEQDFILWIERNEFLNTVADRFVTGYPQDEIKELTRRIGYVDHLINTAEPYHQWVIEVSNPRMCAELPLVEAGLNAVWTSDLTPYRTRKVRLLNGAHTVIALTAYLCGKHTLKQCMDDPLLYAFIRKALSEEIMPTLDLPREQSEAYVDSVLERMANPLMKYPLLPISFHSISKFRTTVLPSLLEYRKRNKRFPPNLCFSLAALIMFYRGSTLKEGRLAGKRGSEVYWIEDELPHLERLCDMWAEYDGTPASACRLVSRVLEHEPFWGMNLNTLNGLTAQISTLLVIMLNKGMPEAVWLVLQGQSSKVDGFV